MCPPQEQCAAGAVARAVGATWQPHDVGRRQGVVDVTLTYPNGRTVALEVTSQAEQGTQERDAVLAREKYQWPNPGVWTWSIRLAPAASIAELRRRYARIITVCEQAGATHPWQLPWQTQWHDPDLRWLIDHPEVTMLGMPGQPGSAGPGPVWVHADGAAGFVDEQLVDLPAAVDELLRVPVIARHVRKLLAHGADEHHLFVFVGVGGLPASQYLPLLREVQVLPPTVPSLPAGLSHLWLTTGYGPSLLCCTPAGWSNYRVLD